MSTFDAVSVEKSHRRASLHKRWLHVGAANEARTRYLHLGKVALYQMSYGRILETLLGLLTGASDRNRTNDTGIFSPLLYRLSYLGIIYYGGRLETRTLKSYDAGFQDRFLTN